MERVPQECTSRLHLFLCGAADSLVLTVICHAQHILLDLKSVKKEKCIACGVGAASLADCYLRLLKATGEKLNIEKTPSFTSFFPKYLI